MDKYWSKKIKKTIPYTPGEQPKDKNILKLNTNENPYPPSKRATDAILGLDTKTLRLYPDPSCADLIKAIADCYDLQPGQVFVGNSSDEILAFSFMAFFNPGDTITFPEITYSFYEVYASFFGLNCCKIPLDGDFNIPIDGFFAKSNGVIFANPNAPTGRLIPLEGVRAILEKNKNNIVIVDEAYIDFGGESSTGLIDDYSNLLVIHTFSKSRALAGLRVGFALGNEGLIEGLNRVKNSINSYTLDRIALIGAEEAIKDVEYFDNTRKKIINTREKTTKRLLTMGFKVIDSKANFIFISYPNINAIEIFKKLKEKNILVRHFNKQGIDNFLRVSIGTDDEMDCFCGKIGEIIKDLE
ncbi:MAG: histidinol-phosphate transaminase [Clostridium sp.]|nr:histidinol-phosphate transaminase [Clostridium sp.]